MLERLIKKKKIFLNYIDDSVVLVFSIYLELFEYFNKTQSILNCIDHYAKRYPNNKIVFFWNHDNDFRKYNDFVIKYNNVVILNYNTSCVTPNDIVVPFWSMNTDQVFETKTRFCSFVGTINNQIRSNLNNTFSQNPLYYFTNRLDLKEYKKTLSQSIFNFAPRGLGLSSYRFFECLHYNTIPVLFADDVVLPFLDELNYKDICVQIPENKSTNFDYVNDLLHDIDHEKILSNISINRSRFTLEGIQQYIEKRLK